MRALLSHLDELLRGQRTQPQDLAAGKLNLPLAQFFWLAIVLGAGYGFFMGWFGTWNRTPTDSRYLLASMIKLPALFLLTLLITLPSLYVFNALIGCRLSFLSTLKLLIAAIVVNLAVAASFGTILGFFTLSTNSYHFMIVLNVLLLAIAGMVGLGFLLRVLRRLALWQAELAGPIAPPITPDDKVAAAYQVTRQSDLLGPANAIFRVWVVIFALVGAQMGWLLRPFIGSPKMDFAWFRPRSGNFFQAFAGAVQALFQGQ